MRPPDPNFAVQHARALLAILERHSVGYASPAMTAAIARYQRLVEHIDSDDEERTGRSSPR
jgi:hypothetical protein